VAAGFPYRPIRTVEQMPDCFSRPICRLAPWLNDMANDQERQRLLPYVTRLACADTRKVEQAREAYIRRHAGYDYDHHAGYDYLTGMPLSRAAVLSFDRGLEALEGALSIGRQADPLGPAEVQDRMDAARAGQDKSTKAAAPVAAQNKPFLSNLAIAALGGRVRHGQISTEHHFKGQRWKGTRGLVESHGRYQEGQLQNSFQEQRCIWPSGFQGANRCQTSNAQSSGPEYGKAFWFREACCREGFA
jgi:hypothetical protein